MSSTDLELRVKAGYATGGDESWDSSKKVKFL